jgi:hypothetical protein
VITDREAIVAIDKMLRAHYGIEWLPVTEKSPPTDQAFRVLVFVDGGVHVARRRYSFPPLMSRFTPDEEGRNFAVTPTHWMPLPEPPST